MTLKKEISTLAKQAKEASKVLAIASTERKNSALLQMADGLKKESRTLIRENKKDLRLASQRGKSKAYLDRLALNQKRVRGMVDSLHTIAKLTDPVGEMIQTVRLTNGMTLGRMRVPLGVIAIIYESRPDVTSDTAGLCLKSGNAVVLKGGSDALHSNRAIASSLQKALKRAGLPPASVSLIKRAGHKVVPYLLRQTDTIDLVIPRGGESLIREVVRLSRIPVMKHDKGVCNIFVDAKCDLNMAERIVMNAKIQRPGTCNALETLLVHEEIAPRFLPPMIRRLQAKGVEIRGGHRTQRLVKGIKRASVKDWSTEYLDLILSIRIVKDLSEAIQHIGTYGSMHTDAIVTDSHKHAMRFLQEVDSSCVFVNASTRLSDGGVFGMGAEMGISTGKLHARGPVGLTELTSYKFVGFGNVQLRT